MVKVWRNVAQWLVAIALLGSLLGGPWRASAQPDVDAVRARVNQWLLQTLGRPGLLLVEFTYAGTSWPDTSMDCPVEGQTYEPEMVHGYRWTFLYDNMVRYEVHSGVDGTPAVLCGATNAGPTVRLSAYTSPVFTILRPDAWLVFPSSDGRDVLFAPRPQVTCETPGMRVSTLGRVAAGVTADQLIDEHVRAIGARDGLVARASVGPSGRTTRVETACESLQRAWRISAFVQYGSAFRVEQWAPLDEFQLWDELFSNMLGQFGTVESVLPTESGPAAGNGSGEVAASSQAARAPLPLAHLFAGDVFVAALNDLPGRAMTITPDTDRRYLTFAPDGLHLAFIDTTHGRLYVAGADSTAAPRRMADGASDLFPPAWKPDGARIAFAAEDGAAAANGEQTITLYALLTSGGTVEPIATFPFVDNCPAPLPDPAEVAYARENSGQERVLLWLPGDRFLVSQRCDGGLALLEQGALRPLGDDLRGGVRSPDGVQFLARSAQGLALIDLATGERTNMGIGGAARQLAWAPDGQTVYYGTAALVDGLTLDDAAEQARGAAFFGQWPVTLGVYDLALVRLNLASREEGAIWRGPGRGIGRIAPAPDGSGLLFSMIPSSARLAEVFASGGDAHARRQAWPEPALFWLATDAPVALLVAYSGQPAFAPVTLH